MKIDKRFRDKYQQKITERTNYVLGYTRPQFTEEEWELQKKWVAYRDWTPNTKGWSGNPYDEFYIVPQPQKPHISRQLLEKIKQREEWIRLFNINCDKHCDK